MKTPGYSDVKSSLRLLLLATVTGFAFLRCETPDELKVEPPSTVLNNTTISSFVEGNCSPANVSKHWLILDIVFIS